MASDDAVLVEDFLEAIASQLDRAQDGLAFKAVNRPLTYAIKDFNLQLQVFVEMDSEGNVRLRGSGPNETGATTMTIGFTTITRPMIQENTISLAATKGPSLDEAGFDPAERQRLERLGVRNTAQLRRLGSSTGATLVSRLTQIPVDRLRAALQVEPPAVTSVRPVAVAPARARQPRLEPAPAEPAPDGAGVRVGPIVSGPGLVDRMRMSPRVVRIGPDASHLQFAGTSLATEDETPEVRLDGVPLTLSESDWDRFVVAVPPDAASGLLEVALPGGSVRHYRLERDGDRTEVRHAAALRLDADDEGVDGGRIASDGNGDGASFGDATTTGDRASGAGTTDRFGDEDGDDGDPWLQGGR